MSPQKKCVFRFRPVVWTGAFVLFLTFAYSVHAQESYQQSLKQWRDKTETDLKSDDSWLTLAGLFWLKEGVNTIGSEQKADIQLPASAPAEAGFIDFKNGVATIHVKDAVNLTSDDKPVSILELASDEKGKPTIIKSGDVSFNVIKREDRYGIRVKDKNSPERRNFKGLHWYPGDEKYIITAQFTPYDAPKEIMIPNVLGGAYKSISPGILTFKLNGQEYKLEPIEQGDQLFIIFRDLTSSSTTYAAGRFLDTDKAKDGKVILDFNKAYNPPCAFTTFATCPLPPQQNRLNVEIPVGEKKYHE